jgi:alpha-beta hydrolase superfamily lysophospholipase
VLVVLVLLLAAIAYGLWWLSGRIGDTVAVPKPDAGYPITIASVVDDRVAYSGVPEAVTDEGAYALRTADGAYVQTVDPVVTPDGTTTRTVVAKVSPPALEAGARATLDSWYFGNDPEQALGLAFEDVNYATPLGPAGAWVIPGKSSTWVVYVHGRGDSPGQGLRLAQTVSPLGYPMMLIRYRNDPMAPEGSGYAHFGSDEWMDLEGAIGYALEHGADRIVLAGSGMGGAISLAFLENSSFADAVVGAVFDAPAVDIGATVEQEASDMGIPSFVIPLAQQVASWRYGLDWAAMDYVSRAQEVDIPILITQGTDDTSVLPASVESFAAAVPGARVRVEEFDGAGHTLAWNVDPARFDAVVSDFLSGAAPAR